MTTARYIEIDSTYRNRKEWPLPSEFEMLISQTGRKNRLDAVDPVSNAASYARWTSNTFNTTGSSATVAGTVVNISPGFGASGDTNSVITLLANVANTFQQVTNYYKNAVLFDTVSNKASRILSYR